MKVIALIGGIASGKSTVAKYLHDLGAGVIDGDKVAHAVLNIPEIVDQMKMRWPSVFFCLSNEPVNGGVRKQIADIVFKDQDELEFLEAITWPQMKERMLKSLSLYHPKFTPAVVIDFPLFVDSGLQYEIPGGVQYWYMDCPPEVRLARFRKRRADAGVVETEEECMDTYVAREGRQEKLKYKFDLRDVTIKTDATKLLPGEDPVRGQVITAWYKHVVKGIP